MSFKLEELVVALINAKDSVKVLATTDKKGVPHVVVKDSISVNEKDELIYLELIESSKTNENLVSSIWFKRRVAVNVTGSDGTSFQIKGTPVKCIISGPVFEHYYIAAKERYKEADLSAVWVIEPEEARNETYAFRREEEEKQHPLLIHLDRLAK